MSPISQLEGARYISLRSFKKSGEPVDTPVWFAQVDGDQRHVGHPGHLIVFTDGTSYKVKRIRRNPKVEVARCDARGKLLGPWLPGTCRPVENEPQAIERAYRALGQKYGLQMRILNVFSTLGGRIKRRLILEITLGGVG